MKIKTKIKRITGFVMAMILCIILFMPLMTVTVFAAEKTNFDLSDGAIQIYVNDTSGTPKIKIIQETQDDCLVAYSSTKQITIYQSENSNATYKNIKIYKSTSGLPYTINITLAGVNIKSENNPAIYIKNHPAIYIEKGCGPVNLSLAAGTKNYLAVDGTYAALQKESMGEKSMLTISGSGSLEARGGTGSAGIGEGYTHITELVEGEIFYSEYITIAGGNILAVGGGADHSNGVTATGAGIGQILSNSYNTMRTANIKITGGTVRAQGAISPIGETPWMCNGIVTAPENPITITGGSVWANGASDYNSLNAVSDGKNPVRLYPINIPLLQYDSDGKNETPLLATYGISSISGVSDYGLQDVHPDKNGYLYLWLPENTKIDAVSVDIPFVVDNTFRPFSDDPGDPSAVIPATVSSKNAEADTFKCYIYTTLAAPTVAAPVIGELSEVNTVRLTTATKGAVIYYTTDGTDPTASSGTLYTGAVPIESACTLKAVAVLGSNTTAVVSKSFDNLPVSVALNGITANGSDTASTTELTVTFDKDIDGLSVKDFVIDGATAGTLTKVAGQTGVYKLTITDIKVADGAVITVEVAKSGFSFTPPMGEVEVRVYTPPAHTHNMTHYPRVEPTHFTAGNIEYWYCEGCRTCFSDANGTQEISQSDITLAVIPHSFGTVWSSDTNGHWHECSCGTKADYAAHSYDTNTWESDAQGHWHECVCGAKSDYALHIVGRNVWSGDADGHWHPCDICAAKLSYEAHSFGTDWVSDANGHWHECVCGAKADYTAHSPGTVWKSDMLGHWHECVCGVKTDYTAHTVVTVTDNEATETSTGAEHTECSVCKYVLSSTIIPVIDNTPDVTTTVDEETGITTEVATYKNGSVVTVFSDKNGNKSVISATVGKDGYITLTVTYRNKIIYTIVGNEKIYIDKKASDNFEISDKITNAKISRIDVDGKGTIYLVLYSGTENVRERYQLDGTLITEKRRGLGVYWRETVKPDGTVITETFGAGGKVTSSETKTADGAYLAEIYAVTAGDAVNTAVVGADLMKKLVESKSPALNVQLPGASISFDAGALDAMNKNNAGKDIKLSAKQRSPRTIDNDSIAKNFLDRYKNAVLWEFRMNDGGADFGNGTATAEIEYARQNPNATVAAYHFLPDGSAERVPGTAYKDGKFAIPMKGWSLYAIVEELEGEADTTDGNPDKDNITWLWITVAAFAVAAAGITGVILYGKHKKKA